MVTRREAKDGFANIHGIGPRRASTDAMLVDQSAGVAHLLGDIAAAIVRRFENSVRAASRDRIQPSAARLLEMRVHHPRRFDVLAVAPGSTRNPSDEFTSQVSQCRVGFAPVGSGEYQLLVK